MRINTTAGEVHKELEKLGIYPWQYQDYKLVSVNYNVVLSDIETYWNTEARLREGFKVDEEKKEIYVPNFFTKVNGIHHKKDDYYKFVLMLKDAKNTVVMNSNIASYGMPRDLECKKICSTIEEANTIGKEDFYELNINNLLNGKFFIYETKFSHFDELTSAKQKTVLALIERVLQEKKNEWNEEKMVRFIITCLNIPKSVMVILNNFDYSFDVPKILYTGNTMDEDTAMCMWILNELGFDIILLAPSGKNTIERYFDINELSLGYFVEDIEFDKIKTEEQKKREAEEIKAEKAKEKERKKKKKKENFSNFVGNMFDAILEHIFAAIWFIIATAYPITAILLWVNNIGGFAMFITCVIYGVILFISGLILDEMGAFETDACGGFLIFVILAVVVILCSRGIHYMVTDPEASKSTHKHDGFFEIEEPIEKGTNDFVVHYRKEAVGQDGYNYAYLYIENNAENITDMYFVVKYKNKVIYESGKVEPMEYVPKITFNSEAELPIGEHELQIEFYRYDNEADKKEKYTDELLGKGTITLHIFDSSKEVKTFKEENSMDEYCSD